MLKQMQYRDGSGNATIGSYKRFLDGSLTVVSTVRESEALAGVYNLQRRNFLITVMILCASMFLLFFFSKSLTDPIKVLVAGANRIKGGDFDLRITPKANDEIGTLALSFNDMTRGLAERDKMKSAFSKFVNKDIAERVLKGDIQLGGESKQAAIFFSDIRSFTAISETLTPHEVVDFLNQYMTRMVKCVDANHGVVDKFIGDAIMAVWGVPDSHGNDTANAIDAALEMRLSLAEFNRDRGGPKAPIIRIGCGINTGEVIAGQIGSLDRMEYTCIGDSVNLASRIESINKLFHTDILISEYSYSLVRGRYAVAPMKPIRVKGKEDPQQIFAVLGRIDDPNGFRTIGELRAFLGYGDVDVESIDPDQEEHKYEVVE
jgi:adenylate cyclase